MTIMVAVEDNPEGVAALDVAVAEARRWDTDLIVFNLALRPIGPEDLPDNVGVRLVERHGPDDHDPVEAVLNEIRQNSVQRLVIGVRHPSRVGKAILGSVGQRLILDAPVPVLAVKAHGEYTT